MGVAVAVRVLSISALGAAVGCGVEQTGGGDAGTAASVNVSASYLQCPRIDSLSVIPDQVDVGSPYPIPLAAVADVPGGAMPLYSWSAPSGSFGDASAPLTTFMCTAPGVVPVSCTASYDGCADELSVPVTCGASDDAGSH